MLLPNTPPPALLVHSLSGVAGQGGHHADTLGRQELGQVLLTRLEEDGEVAAVQDRAAKRGCALDQEAELRVELGRAPSEVDRPDRGGGLQHAQGLLRRSPGHDLSRAQRGALHVAVPTGLVAV